MSLENINIIDSSSPKTENDNNNNQEDNENTQSISSINDINNYFNNSSTTSIPNQSESADLSQQNEINSLTTSIPNTASSIPLPQPPENPANTVPSKTLWMGDLEAWWDEPFITDLWEKLDKHVEVKLIKPKHDLLIHQLAKTNGQGTANHSGYCFIEFDSQEIATEALSLNGKVIPNTNNNKFFRLNWASAATLDSQIAQTPEFSLFVGDLSSNTTEAHLLSLFQSHFNSIKTVRVMTDPSTGISRCFGFVRFSNEEDRRNALVEMNGKWLGGRQIRVALASPKHQNNNNNNHNNNGMNISMNNMGMNMNNRNNNQPLDLMFNNHNNLNNQLRNNNEDLNNTTVFVGGLANGLHEDTLLALFEPFGPIVNIKVPPGKGCGFVKFNERKDAEKAIEGMQGFIISGSRIRLSWGRPNNRSRQISNNLQHPMYRMNMNNMNMNMNMNLPMNNMNVPMSMNLPPPQLNNLNNIPNMSNIPPSQMNNMGMNMGMNIGYNGGYNYIDNDEQTLNQQSSGSELTNDGNITEREIYNNSNTNSHNQSYNQRNLQPNVPPHLLSPNQIHPNMVESTIVGIPQGIPPPFIYDPYYNNNVENDQIPTNSSNSNNIIENHNGMLPIHGHPGGPPPPPPPGHPMQQYVFNQNGQYMFVPSRPFQPNQMMQPRYEESNDSPPSQD